MLSIQRPHKINAQAAIPPAAATVFKTVAIQTKSVLVQ
jgi:hypothetical protein